MDSGADFERQIFAKINAPDVLRQELSRPKWSGEPIAIGTASDPYEPAEAQYRLTRQILETLIEFRNPASITTKGTLVAPGRRRVAPAQRNRRRSGCVQCRHHRREDLAPNGARRSAPHGPSGGHAIPGGARRAGRRVLAAPLLPGTIRHRSKHRRPGSGGRRSTVPSSSPAICCSCGPAAGNGLCRLYASRTHTWPRDTHDCTGASTLRGTTPTPCSRWLTTPGCVGNCPGCLRSRTGNRQRCPGLRRPPALNARSARVGGEPDAPTQLSLPLAA